MPFYTHIPAIALTDYFQTCSTLHTSTTSHFIKYIRFPSTNTTCSQKSQ